MKLVNHFSVRLALLIAPVMALWAAFFYVEMVNEVNDEADDALEDYAETVIMKSLAGEDVPTTSAGTNHQYFQREVSEQYARRHGHVRYEDRTVYVKEKREYEPARVITYIYRDARGRLMEIEVSAPNIDKGDLKKAILFWTAALYALLLAAIMAIALLTIYRSVEPLRQLLQWIGRYSIGESGTRPEIKEGITEFNRIADALAESARRNGELYRQQKQFIANASHEMQTPLAVFQNRLETLLDGGGLTEWQTGEIIKTISGVKALSKLNRSLLLLTKIDSGQCGQTEKVDLAAEAAALLPDFQAVYGAEGITAEADLATPFHTEANPALAATLVSNLLKNAFVHTPGGGRVRVVSDNDRLSVANTAEGEIDASKIFQRFYHNPAKKASTGLGLPIAKAICRQYSLQLSYRPAGGMHLFEITKG